MSATWTPEIDRYALWVEPWPGGSFVPEPFGADPATSLLMQIDERGEETGRVVGIEIPILEFDAWDEIPDLPLLWQLGGWGPLPLAALLRRVQSELRLQTTPVGGGA